MNGDRLFRISNAPQMIFDHLVDEQFTKQQVYIWHKRGCNGRRLKATSIGNALYTCLDWLRDFFGMSGGSDLTARPQTPDREREEAKQMILNARKKAGRSLA